MGPVAPSLCRRDLTGWSSWFDRFDKCLAQDGIGVFFIIEWVTEQGGRFVVYITRIIKGKSKYHLKNIFCVRVCLGMFVISRCINQLKHFVFLALMKEWRPRIDLFIFFDL